MARGDRVATKVGLSEEYAGRGAIRGELDAIESKVDSNFVQLTGRFAELERRLDGMVQDGRERGPSHLNRSGP